MDEINKPLAWLYGEVKTPPFTPEARIEAGVLLRRLQRGGKSWNASLKTYAEHW